MYSCKEKKNIHRLFLFEGENLISSSNWRKKEEKIIIRFYSKTIIISRNRTLTKISTGWHGGGGGCPQRITSRWRDGNIMLFMYDLSYFAGLQGLMLWVRNQNMGRMWNALWLACCPGCMPRHPNWISKAKMCKGLLAIPMGLNMRIYMWYLAKPWPIKCHHHQQQQHAVTDE